MPKIPQVYSEPGQVQAGGSVKVPLGEGTGLNAFGNDMASLAYLYPSFQAAAAQRARAEAHLDGLRQDIGAAGIAIQAETSFKDTASELTQHLQKKPLNPGEAWTIQDDDGHGGSVAVKPNDALMKRLNATYKNAVDTATSQYGLEAGKQVATHLQGKFLETYSKFSDASLNIRIDKEKGALQETLTHFMDAAGDPNNPSGAYDMSEGKRRITVAEENGLLSSQDAAKMRVDFEHGISDRKWTITAQTEPDRVMAIAEDAAAGKQLPAGMDPKNFDNYVKLAQGTMSTRQSSHDKREKDLETELKASEDKTFNELVAKSYSMDVSQQAQMLRTVLPNKFNDIMALNQANAKNRTTEVTKDKVEASKVAQLDYANEITKAMLGHGNLDDINDRITQQVQAGELQPEHGLALHTQVQSAMTHLQSEGTTARNKEITQAHSVLIQGLTTTGPMDKWDAVSEEAKRNASEFFYRKMGQDPSANAWDVKAEAEKIFNPIVKERKNLSEKATNRLDDARMQSLVSLGAMSRATYKAVSATREQDLGNDIVMKALQELPPPPPPSMMDRFKDLFKADPNAPQRPAQRGGGVFKFKEPQAE